MRSPSRGRIKLKSKDPFEHPSILFNYMSTEQDWREFRDAIRITREIMLSLHLIHIVAKKSVR
jgi:choline dehydrogenase